MEYVPKHTIGGGLFDVLDKWNQENGFDDVEPGPLIPKPKILNQKAIGAKEHKLNGNGTFVESMNDVDDWEKYSGNSPQRKEELQKPKISVIQWQQDL